MFQVTPVLLMVWSQCQRVLPPSPKPPVRAKTRSFRGSIVLNGQLLLHRALQLEATKHAANPSKFGRSQVFSQMIDSEFPFKGSANRNLTDLFWLLHHGSSITHSNHKIGRKSCEFARYRHYKDQLGTLGHPGITFPCPILGSPPKISPCHPLCLQASPSPTRAVPTAWEAAAACARCAARWGHLQRIFSRKPEETIDLPTK